MLLRKGDDHTVPCFQVFLACAPGLSHCPALPPRHSRGADPAPRWEHSGPRTLLGAEGPGDGGTPTSGWGCQGYADPNQPATLQPGTPRVSPSPFRPTTEEIPEAVESSPGRRESGPPVRGGDIEVSDKAGFQPTDHTQLQVGSTGRGWPW